LHPDSQLPRRVHLLGAAGDGMLGLAEYLIDAGHHVSGSDIRRTPATCISGVGAFELEAAIPGKHMIANALACVAACYSLGVPFAKIAKGLAAFTGVSRRWQDCGSPAGIQVIDDYAHHPAELHATIETARSVWGSKRRLAIAFQPQLFTRTLRLFDEFVAVLSRCDAILLVDIDPAGERPIVSVSSTDLASALRRMGRRVEVFRDVDDLVSRAPRFLASGDGLIIAGAGTIRAAAEQLVSQLRTHSFDQDGGDFADAAPAKVAGLGLSVISAFRRHVAAEPSHCAVVERAQQLSYVELDARSDEVVRLLESRGFSREAIVGVGLRRSVDLIVVVVALAKMGAVYVPLDGDLPLERLRYMIESAGCGLIVSLAGSRFDNDIGRVDKFFLDNPGFRGVAIPGVPVSATRKSRGEIAYICFTSGSTGYPKGVAIQHSQLAGLVADIVQRFGIGSEARTALNTPVGFDVSLAEIWMTLCGGGTLVVASSAKPLTGKWLADFIDENRITHVAATPSLLASLPERSLPTLKCIISAGEICPQDIVDRMAQGRKFFNAYGPTEATIYATAAWCRPGKSVTIGKPLPHVNTYVLDENDNPVGKGEDGELCLGGCAVAGGYIGQERETTAKFFNLEIDGKNDWVFRTGDIVRSDAEGDLAFVGRRDDQIKLRGYRIEIGEIESSIKRIIGDIDPTVCVIDNGRTKELVCFVADGPNVGDCVVMRERLAQWLPDYMVPTKFVTIESTPLNANGKKDRQRLLSSYRGDCDFFSSAMTPFGAQMSPLASIWRPFHVDPAEIESALCKCPGIEEAAVLARMNPRGDAESFAAYVVAASRLPEAQISFFLRKCLPEYLLPSELYQLHKIPRLSDGRIDTSRLPTGRIPHDAPGANDTSLLVHEVAAIFDSIVGSRGAGPQDNLASLGVDSLQAVVIAVQLERHFGIPIPPAAFEGAQSIKQLAEWIACQIDLARQKGKSSRLKNDDETGQLAQ
jgi:amino acid adenylation domain-containing protein